jgi:hypothetical protein
MVSLHIAFGFTGPSIYTNLVPSEVVWDSFVGQTSRYITPVSLRRRRDASEETHPKRLTVKTCTQCWDFPIIKQLAIIIPAIKGSNTICPPHDNNNNNNNNYNNNNNNYNKGQSAKDLLPPSPASDDTFVLCGVTRPPCALFTVQSGLDSDRIANSQALPAIDSSPRLPLRADPFYRLPRYE